MQLQTNLNGEALPKGPRRKRKRDYDARPKTAPLWKRLLRCGMFVLEGRIEKPIPRKLEIAAESSLEDRSEFLKFEPPALRVELANFIGWMTAKGVDAEDAEKEFFRMVRQGAWPRIKRRAGYEPKGLTLGMNQPSGRVKGARVLKKEDDSPFKSCAT